jgi:hypothetical protein
MYRYMRDPYMCGVADTRREFNMIADFSASMSHGYGPGHHAWSYGKLRDRMVQGLAIPYPVFYARQLVAVTVAYAEPPSEAQPTPGIEYKLVRTLGKHENWGLGRVTMKGTFNEACHRMGLAPGTPVRTHLDTRNPAAIAGFSAMGFIATGETCLYPENPEAPDSPPDVLFEKIIRVPENLYDRQ